MIHFFLHQLLILEQGWNSSKKNKRALRSSQLLTGQRQASYCRGFHGSTGTGGWWGQGHECCPRWSQTPGIYPFSPGSSRPLSTLEHFPTMGQQLQKSLRLPAWIKPKTQKGALQNQTFVPLSPGSREGKKARS